MPSVRKMRRTRRPLLALLALVIALVVGYAVKAADSGGGPSGPPSATTSESTSGSKSPSTAASGVPSGPVALSALPAQVAQTVAAIRSGGPFPYPDDDGVVFHNYEHELPREPDGYYREYTVPTPGSDDRGARRLVTGRGGQFYYTGDHYASFRRVDVSR